MNMKSDDVSIEVSVPCMNQEDDSLYEKTNLQTDALLINQCNHNSYFTKSIGDNKVRIISTVI